VACDIDVSEECTSSVSRMTTKFDPEDRGSTGDTHRVQQEQVHYQLLLAGTGGVYIALFRGGWARRNLYRHQGAKHKTRYKSVTNVVTVYITYLGRAVNVKQQKTLRKFLLLFGPKCIVTLPAFA
jgi:hypothetical protein